MGLQRLSIVQNYAAKFLGLPYIWGGSHPSLGYDCSGLAQEILAAIGIDPPGDQTAQTLFSSLKNDTTNVIKPEAGSFLFFGSSITNITHVAFALDELHMIEAGGGGSSCKTVQDAIKHNAFVRVRPIAHRKDLLACLLPRY